jgi:transcriptional regulator with XRE-family HTH domain
VLCLIRDEMEHQSLSGRRLAQRMGVSSSTLFSVLRGTSSPSLNTLARIATALEVRITVLFEPLDARDCPICDGGTGAACSDHFL